MAVRPAGCSARSVVYEENNIQTSYSIYPGYSVARADRFGVRTRTESG